ncbi:MAG: hypothetical protein MJZ79_07005 [Paludibacteraceae bacterium]|nr:hypothetical protein [Paludibacteraceae bacterium]
MLQLIKGQNGGGDCLQIDLDDLVNYKINLMNFQQVLSMVHPQRENVASKKRVWIMYKGKPICELGLQEIKDALDMDKNQLNKWQNEAIYNLNTFIAANKSNIEPLLGYKI